ncbi:hypothetical protein [Gymnodinialimonas ceratoperidinii]|uniref:Sulfotransferase family protein n=1 Tax=Gymnodinialimonas ceratoperidinii TaxID=2856823 RepID=A0A8F6TY84_9RHOB|nr:hypothetical protein [Gymnodinialimonas ceratoperidinii]QXT41111.1 hypothetical protein KYE46_07825 [Gymnodinialimonas ceratoperidinii]
MTKSLTSLPVFTDDIGEPGPRTVVCFGTARGGTSMVAGAILGLGVPMGPDLGRNLEDPAFNFDAQGMAMEGFLQHARDTVEARNQAHEIWGWKFPNAARYLEQLAPHLRAPHLVCVFRDPVPAALRRAKTPEEAPDFIAGRLRAQMRNTELIEKLKLPCLMVSYEKASAQPAEFVQELAQFLRLPIPAHVDEIVAFMARGSYKDPAPLLNRLTGAP